MKTMHSWIEDPSKNCIFIGEPEVAEKDWFPAKFYTTNNYFPCVKLLRGKRMMETNGLFSEISSALQFPETFGWNFDAMDELLRYLDEWMPCSGYLLLFHNSEYILSEDNRYDIRILMNVIGNVAKFWSEKVEGTPLYNRDAIPFSALFLVSPGKYDDVKKLARIAEDISIPYRTID